MGMKQCLFPLLLVVFSVVARAQDYPLYDVDSLRLALVKANGDTQKVSLLINIAGCYNAERSLQSFSYASSALMLARQMGWKKGEADALEALGVYYGAAADYGTALGYLEKALSIYNDIGDRYGLASAYRNIGGIYDYLTDLPKCQEYYTKALELDLQNHDLRSLRVVCRAIGGVYWAARNFDEALKYWNYALVLSRAIHDKRAEATALMNVGEVHAERHEYEDAFAYLNESLQISRQIGFTAMMENVYGELTRLMTKRGDYLAALGYGNAAMALHHENDSTKNSPHSPIEDMLPVYVLIANDSSGGHYPDSLRDKKAMLTKAERELIKRIGIARKLKRTIVLRNMYRTLSEAQELLGKKDAALESYKMFVLFQDSINSETYRREISRLEVQRVSNLKDKEIEAEKLRVARAKLERSLIIGGGLSLVLIVGVALNWYRLRQKYKISRKIAELNLVAMRSRMDPHFISNLLGSVQASIHNIDTRSAESYLEKTAKLIRMSMVNSDRQSIPVTEELDMLRAYTELQQLRFKDRFALSIIVDQNVDMEAEIPSMLIQPFVENAILHAFQGMEEPGTVELRLSRKGDLLYCTITDDGIGISRSKAAKAGSGRRSFTIHDTHERIDSLKKIHNVQVGLRIEEVHGQDGRVMGTRVELVLPIVERF